MALWQQSKNLGLNSSAGVSASSLSEVPRGGPPVLTRQEICFNQQVEGLKDLDRLLEFVTEQEKKYGERLSPHSNYHCRHRMVQNFLWYQVKIYPSSVKRLDSSLHVAWGFKRDSTTARNIV